MTSTATGTTADIACIVCMACGDRFRTIAESMEHPHMQSDNTEITAEQAAHFEKIWEAEFLVQTETALDTFQLAGQPMYRKGQIASNLERAKKALSDLIDALTPEEGKAYGIYRRGIFAEIAALDARDKALYAA